MTTTTRPAEGPSAGRRATAARRGTTATQPNATAPMAAEPTAAELGLPGLLAEVERMRQLLRERLAGEPAHALRPAAASTLDDVAARLALSGFERDLLALLVAVQLDGEVAGLVAELGGVGDPRPTFALAMGLLAGAHWDALTPDRPLRRWHLVELAPGPTLATRPLTIDEHVLHTLTGLTDATRLSGLVDPTGESLEARLAATQERQVEEMLAACRAIPGPLLVAIGGTDPDAARTVAARICEGVGRGPLMVRDAVLEEVELQLAATLLDREALLSDRVVVTGSARLVAHLESPLVIVLGPAAAATDVPTTRMRISRSVDLPEPDERLSAWRAAAPDAPTGVLHDLAQHYRLPVRSVAVIAGEWRALDGGEAELRRLTRERARVDLSPLAERVEPRATWADLVLPEGQLGLLHDLAAQVRHRALVHDGWGFARQSSRGLGITALFSGESGTGKTMAAEVIAGELGHDLWRIDLSAVVSKYIGETEAHLRTVFDAAERSGAVLLFDEADALFGRRSDVRDSHDRYANLEVAYLLARMESYRGLAILTTNLRTHLDRAFLRRLRFVVQFPVPDESARAEIWRRSFPAAAPTEGLDPVALARLQVSGGSIRSIALAAAFAAADDGGVIGPRHVLHAAQVEYAKAERQLTDAETAALRRGIRPGGDR